MTPKRKSTKHKSSGYRPKKIRRPSRVGAWLLRTFPFLAPRTLLKAALLAFIWGFVLVGVVVAFFAYEIPDILKHADLKKHPAIIMEDASGTVFARYGDYHGDTVSVSSLPRYLPQAFLAIEDRRFYDHGGVDPWGILRAALRNAFAGHVVQGGSTITQQLAKNLFLGNKRTFRRKVQELLLSFWLENKLSKDEILSAYLNRIYLGSGAYGVDAAARLYFNKPAREVSLYEAAMLAALPKAPSHYSPLNDPAASAARARVVLQAMKEAKFISENTKDNVVSYTPLPVGERANTVGRYFADWVMEEMDGLIDEQDDDVYVRTTLDMPMQQDGENRIEQTLAASGQAKNISQAALVSMDLNGGVRSLVGGRDYRLSTFNRAFQAKRQPGSAFKPFVYLTALNDGISADSTLLDAPLKIGSWRPENFENNYRGEVSMQDALAYSINTATIRLAQRVGIGNVRALALRMGISPPLPNNLSLALGTGEVSLLDIVSAYSGIANGGHAVTPYGITSIRSKSGDVLYQRQGADMPRVVNSSAADETAHLMQAVVNYGTGKAANIGVPVSGKTGTTQDYRDAWFIGFTDRLATGVWMGNDDNTPMNKVTGGSLPATLWHDYMLTANGRAQNLPREDAGEGYSHAQSNGITNFIKGLFGGGDLTIEHSYPTGKH